MPAARSSAIRFCEDGVGAAPADAEGAGAGDWPLADEPGVVEVGTVDGAGLAQAKTTIASRTAPGPRR